MRKQYWQVRGGDLMGEAKRRRERGETPRQSEDVEHLSAALGRQLVDMANANEANMDGTTGPVLELIAANDVVFGVWPDSAEPEGVGYLIIKGLNLVRESAVTDVTRKIRMTAIKCVEAEQAVALQEHVGTDRTH